MTSEEIKNLKLARNKLVGVAVHDAMAVLAVELNELVREIAYQLAVANERNVLADYRAAEEVRLDRIARGIIK